MARTANPFRPGFNLTPAVIEGRDDVVAAAQDAFDGLALDHKAQRPLLLVGPRGVGKTVTLGQLDELVRRERQWPTIRLELRPRMAFTAQLSAALDEVTDLLHGTTPREGGGAHITGGSVSVEAMGFGAAVEVSTEGTGEPDLDQVMTALERCAMAALERECAVVVLLDELQEARKPDLAAFTAALQRAAGEDWPVLLVAAGLPSLRGTRRTVSYLERAEWHELGPLSPTDTRRALKRTVTAAGLQLDPRAADLLADASGGYPYAVQVFGKYAWRAAQREGADLITAAHARTALVDGERDLASSLYASRWADSSERERDYLRGVARTVDEHGVTQGGDVARELAEAAKALSPYRDRLIRKGTLLGEGEQLRLLVPGMAAWILAQG